MPNPNVRPEFSVHLLNEHGVNKATSMAETFSYLLNEIEGMLPASSREKSLGITHLQEACFFFKRAMALDPANQIPTSEG